MSPEYLMPPSAMIGTSPAPMTASMMAVSCGTPMPVTTRVVQMEPGPTPTLMASTPRSHEGARRASVATLPATSCTSREGLAHLRRGIEHALRVPVRRVDDEGIDARIDERLRAGEEVTARADRGRDEQAPVVVLGGVRVGATLVDVLHGDEADELARIVDDGKLLDAVLAHDLLRRRRARCRPAP
jgi:hypothetical protein